MSESADSAVEPGNPGGRRAKPQPGLACERLHMRVGWWQLLVFLTLGILLEAMHGFKVGWYLDVPNSTRQLMWRLAHAHGTLLSLVHVVFAVTVTRLPRWNGRTRQLASRSLLAASLLIPAGFFLGGLFIYDGDPGLGILLLPPGAFFLLVAVLLTALAVQRLHGDAVNSER